MAGKSYTLREMKTIVDYLVENKLYGDIKGRKMWMDFANSKHTGRTWQSLKETFLKRILPDIHNPYYKMTTEQINSFRAGYDVIDKSKSKLEIHTISDDSSNGSNETNKELKGKNIEEEMPAGEKIQCSKVPPQIRSSADTIILDNCYETAEDIQNELESNGDDNNGEITTTTSKSLRDRITYSEPLTPMLQEVLDDFTSEPEDSDRENQLKIVENPSESDIIEKNQTVEHKDATSNSINSVDVAENAKGLSADEVEEVLAQELDGSTKSDKNTSKTDDLNTSVESEASPVEEVNDEISSMRVEDGSELNNVNSENAEASKITTEELVLKVTEKPPVTVTKEIIPEPTIKSSGQNNSNSTIDASLPNNPEAFLNKNTNDKDSKTVAVVAESNNSATNPLKTSNRKRTNSDMSQNNKDIKKKKSELTLNKSKSNKVPKDSKPDTLDQKENSQVTSVENLKVTDIPNSVKKNVTTEKTSGLEKPSTSFNNEMVDNILLTSSPDKSDSSICSPNMKNPCLQNLSLFDEEINKTKYKMSESSDTQQNKKEINSDQAKQNKTAVKRASKNLVLLDSHSESDNEEVKSPAKKKHRAGVLSTKSERDKAISNMFGFTSGGIGSKHRRQLNQRRRTISHNNLPHTQHNNVVSYSSEWTSESDSDDFVTPPRGGRHKSSKKYLKPKSAKILSLEEEGGLFVMYGKKIFPLVKDGKIVKNYLTYLPESDSEEGESYWKGKYVEEKKKAEELKKLLKKAKEPSHSRDSKSPILMSPPRNPTTSRNQVQEAPTDSEKVICIPEPEVKKEETKVCPPEKITIKFTKNNEEVHLEGHWPQIHPVLEQVVQIFHKESESNNEQKTKMIEKRPSKEPTSGGSTPIVITPLDPDVHEKVNEIEKEIFKEIEELDKADGLKTNEQTENNITKRRAGRPAKRSTPSVPPSPVKQTNSPKKLAIKETQENVNDTKQNETENENITENKNGLGPRHSTRSPRKVLNETVNNDTKTIQTRRLKHKLNTSNEADDDDEVRYMFPPRNSRRLSANTSNKKIHKSFSTKKSSPLDNISLNSIDSTQGYQDSDVSPVKSELRRKKKLNMSSLSLKTRHSLRRSARRTSHPYLYCDAYNDSSNSSVDASTKVIIRENSSLNTEVYRSDSYQLLMPKPKNSFVLLEPIDETDPVNTNGFPDNLGSVTNEVPAQINSAHISSDVGSSSNISLPMSPELSVVENISVSKEMIDGELIVESTLNQNNYDNEMASCSKFITSDVNVTKSPDPKSLVSESLLTNIGTFKIEDQVTVTSLDQKLRDLLLESAKKMSIANNDQNVISMMNVDTNVSTQKQVKSKKRCSTPRKRKGLKTKLTAPNVTPVVEEEHIEHSYSGRKSCPPQLQNLPFKLNEKSEKVTKSRVSDKSKGGKKKDIIKVKILRPKAKKSHETPKATRKEGVSTVSITDSGINDTESEVFLPIDNSIDLIHNHSDTCLHANECVGDSIEFIENSKSVITVGDSIQSGDNLWLSQCECNDSVSPELFCNNAQDMKSFFNKPDTGDPNETDYHSPLGTEASYNSLITEDLSDEALPQRPKKWYLLDEDETTNTNIGNSSPMLNNVGFTSNLKQIFPIMCAVPDLSTITEMSKENEDSRKPTLEMDGFTRDDFNSLSFTDSNFNL